MGQRCSKENGREKFASIVGRSRENDDDVKRQVDSDLGDSRAIYELANVKTGGGKLIELIKSRARRQSFSLCNSSSSSSGQFEQTRTTSSSGSGARQKSKKQSTVQDEQTLDDEIRRLVEPLLYNQGRGKLISLSQLWRFRFGLELIEENLPQEGPYCSPKRGSINDDHRLVCWKLEERGFVGETALHICFLLSTPTHMVLAQKLLKLFPLLINDLYYCEEYFGESCLHMAIVTEDFANVKWLLDAGARVHERCLGSFFLPLDQKGSRNLNERAKKVLSNQKADAQQLDDFDWQSNEFGSNETNYDGYCYFGEFPLSFAASLGLSDCYKLLLAKGADPNKQDSNGNTALHICVIVNRIDMFDLCYSNGANLDILNKQKLSPLTLAAQLERVDMLFHILTIQRQINWIFCGVCFQQLPLLDLDTIDIKDGSFNEKSLLSIAVAGTSDAHLEMLNGILGELLKTKWSTSVKKKFKTWLYSYLVFLAIAALAYLTKFESSTRKGESKVIWRTKVASELAIICFVVYYLFLIARTIFRFDRNPKHWFSIGLNSDILKPNVLVKAPELILALLTCFLILLCIPLRWLQLDEAENVITPIVTFLLPMKFLFFCRASQSIGSFIVVLCRILANAVTCFAAFLIIFVVGFSQSFFVIFKSHKPTIIDAHLDEYTLTSKNHFTNMFDGIVSMHMMALNEFTVVIDGFNLTDYPLLAHLFFIIYMIFMAILMYNLLTAMLGKIYQDITSRPNENLRQWARALLVVERICSNESRLKMLDNYSHKIDEESTQRFYNSTETLKSEQFEEITLVKKLREENKKNSERLAQRQLSQPNVTIPMTNF